MRKVNKEELERMLENKIPFRAFATKEVRDTICKYFNIDYPTDTCILYCHTGFGAGIEWGRPGYVATLACLTSLEEIEIDFSEEKLTFDSQQEVWEWLLIEGNRIINTHGYKVYFKNGKLIHSVHGITDDNFNTYSIWTKYIEPEKKEWYEEIPEQGVLCWVSNYNNKEKIRLIIGYRKDKNFSFIPVGNESTYQKAIPLTQEEVEQYIYKGNKDGYGGY